MNLMANRKELDLLSAGKTIWNAWRSEHAEIQALEPGLYEADLRRADLDGAMPGKANFDGARLSQEEMGGANQEGAMRGKADFDSVNLKEVLQ